MAKRSLPRYFVCRGDAHAGKPDDAHAGELVHAVDSFFAGARHVEQREWVVAVTADGNLAAVAVGQAADLPVCVQSELAHNEVAGSAGARLIEACEFYVFHVELLEQSAETPGLNDPVYLYGTLFGPYPEDSGEGGVEGQLTVTRADVLYGLIEEARYGFSYSDGMGAAGQSLRCLHMMLPGDRDEEIRRGRGIVLAYPLLPPEIVVADVSNELIACQLLYDILSAIKEDLAEEGVANPLRSTVLPVPSRSLLESQLTDQGYVVKGNSATRKGSGRSLGAGLLRSILGSLAGDQVDLPPEGSVDDLIEIAARVLRSLPGWPPPRSLALRNLVKTVSPEARPGGRSKYVSRATHLPAGAATLAAGRGQGQANVSSGPAEWMNDFIDAHRKTGSGSVRLTSTASLARPPSSAGAPAPRQRQAQWMKDFDGGTPVQQKQRKDDSPPDWMKDFE